MFSCSFNLYREFSNSVDKGATYVLENVSLNRAEVGPKLENITI